MRRSIKGGREGAFNRYYESDQCEEILNTIKKHLRIKDNEISNKSDEFLKYINTKRNEFKLEFEKSENDYRETKRKELQKFLERELGEFEVDKELQKNNQNDLLVSNDFRIL